MNSKQNENFVCLDLYDELVLRMILINITFFQEKHANQDETYVSTCDSIDVLSQSEVFDITNNNEDSRCLQSLLLLMLNV